MKFEQGVSILEILLVLVIASIVVVMSVRYIENYKRSENIARLQSGVGQVMDALNEYYFINCNQSDFKDVSLQKLKDAGLLPNDVINPWGDITVSIENHNLNVTAIFIQEQELVPFVSSAMNGSVGDEMQTLNAITWSRLPSQSTGDLFLYPGRQVTMMNKGLSSKLWVLNGELKIFVNQQSRNTCQS